MTNPGSDYAYQLRGRDLSAPSPAIRFESTAERISVDDAGRALYEQRAALLPGLAQGPAPDWQELDESVRGRWRGYAAASLMGRAGR